MIFLHGGPGSSAPGMPSSRDMDAELIKYFTVVHWDRRGAGKSYDKDTPESATILRDLLQNPQNSCGFCHNLIIIAEPGKMLIKADAEKGHFICM